MARSKHPDVEFAVGDKHYERFNEAAGIAVARAVSKGKDEVIDVLVHSKAGARWYGGDEAVEMYDEDPEASVFERIWVRAGSEGRVP
jgi:hypothetical protein